MFQWRHGGWVWQAAAAAAALTLSSAPFAQPAATAKPAAAPSAKPKLTGKLPKPKPKPAADPATAPAASASASAGAPAAAASTAAPSAPPAAAAPPAPAPDPAATPAAAAPSPPPPAAPPAPKPVEGPAIAPAAPPAADAAPAPAAADGDAKHHLLAVTVGGGLLHSSDDAEASGQRGSVAVAVAVRPGGSARGLEIVAAYDDLLGSWDYLQRSPALGGGGLARAEAFEQRHRIGLDVRYDVLRLIRKGLPVHASPLLELGYVRLDSPVYASGTFGGGGGIALAVDLDPRTSIDASFSVLRGFVSDGGESSLHGSVTGLWSWGAGVSLGATDWSRIRLGYVGEALDRESTTRFTNGARLSFLVSFL